MNWHQSFPHCPPFNLFPFPENVDRWSYVAVAGYTNFLLLDYSWHTGRCLVKRIHVGSWGRNLIKEADLEIHHPIHWPTIWKNNKFLWLWPFSCLIGSFRVSYKVFRDLVRMKLFLCVSSDSVSVLRTKRDNRTPRAAFLLKSPESWKTSIQLKWHTLLLAVLSSAEHENTFCVRRTTVVILYTEVALWNETTGTFFSYNHHKKNIWHIGGLKEAFSNGYLSIWRYAEGTSCLFVALRSWVYVGEQSHTISLNIFGLEKWLIFQKICPSYTTLTIHLF